MLSTINVNNSNNIAITSVLCATISEAVNSNMLSEKLFQRAMIRRRSVH